jgi:hypothetical protein
VILAHPPLSEEQQRQRALNARRDLEQLVEFLLSGALDASQDQRRWGTGDRARYFGRGADLNSTVERRVKEIDEHPDAGARADRLIDLYLMLDAAAFIGPCLKTPAVGRQRTNVARGKRLDKVRKPEVINIICEKFDIFRKENPDWKPNTPRRGAHYVAEFLYKPVNNSVTKLIRVKKKSPGLEHDTIARYLREQYPDLFISD